MRCVDNCGYFWKDEDEAFPRCHFEGPDGWAPCEYEEIEDYYFEDEIEGSEEEYE